MSDALDRYGLDLEAISSASCDSLKQFLYEVAVYLKGIVPKEEISRLIEEVADHFESLLEIGEQSFEEIAMEFGSSRELADTFIEAWYTKRSSKSALERRLGPGTMIVLCTFGLATVVYWILLQFRVFLPNYTAIRLPWSPGQIRDFFPEPLPFPDFSIQFLLITGLPLLAPPILGWIVGRTIHLRPHSTIYAVMIQIAIVSYIIGILLLPVTDGLVFAVFQTVYWLPVGCLMSFLSHRLDRNRRAKAASKMRSSWHHEPAFAEVER